MATRTRETLKVLRARTELTQDELAKRASLSTRTIILFEKDVNNLRKAKYETLQRLAGALGVEVDDIFLG